MWMLHLGLAVALLAAGPAPVLAQATEDLPGDLVAGRQAPLDYIPDTRAGLR
jgi:hypothetical protein